MEAPDDRGLRAVRVGGETVGRVWSMRALRRLLRRRGPRDLDLDDPAHVLWLADRSCWPDRPWRRRTTGTLVVLGLLVSAAVLFHVGMTDAFNALAYGGRVVGALFLVTALVQAAAVPAVCDYWGKRTMRYSGTVVLVAVGSVTVTNLMFLVTQIQGWSYTPFLWLWIGLVLWSVWALVTLTRHKVWKGVPYPKGIAASVVVSGAVGIAGIAYSQMYVPYSTPVRIPFTVSFGSPTKSPDGAVLHVPTHVEFRNSGSVRVYVVGTLLTVKGYPTDFAAQGNGADDWKRDLWNYASTLRHVSYSPSRMLGTEEFSSPGGRLDPGNDFSQDFVVDVPLRSGLGRVDIVATASFVRADRGKLGNKYQDSGETSWDPDAKDEKHVWNAPGWVANPGDEFYRFHAKIYHSSEILNLTHAIDYATAWWVLPHWYEGAGFARGDTDPYLLVSISRDSEGEEALDDSQQEPYGMNTLQQSAERTVDQLLKAAKD
ncbi:Yip1 family protein [Streptomyces aureus]